MSPKCYVPSGFSKSGEERRKHKDNIKMVSREIGCEGGRWMNLSALHIVGRIVLTAALNIAIIMIVDVELWEQGAEENIWF